MLFAFLTGPQPCVVSTFPLFNKRLTAFDLFLPIMRRRTTRRSPPFERLGRCRRRLSEAPAAYPRLWRLVPRAVSSSGGGGGKRQVLSLQRAPKGELFGALGPSHNKFDPHCLKNHQLTCSPLDSASFHLLRPDHLLLSGGEPASVATSNRHGRNACHHRQRQCHAQAPIRRDLDQSLCRRRLTPDARCRGSVHSSPPRQYRPSCGSVVVA